jgi:membrane-associated protease RseP (regulator of RpoE activity)
VEYNRLHPVRRVRGLPQLDPSGMEKVQGGSGEASHELPDIAAWRRIIVSVAGPFGNVVLAVALALLIAWMPGVGPAWWIRASAWWRRSRRLGRRVCVPATASTASTGAKSRRGPTFRWMWQLAGGSGEATFGVLRDGAPRSDHLVRDQQCVGLRYWPASFPRRAASVDEVIPGSPAAQSGLQVKDVILAVDETPVLGAYLFFHADRKRRAQPACSRCSAAPGA